MTERMITVCDNCLTASCWHGEFMCWETGSAGSVDVPASQLDKAKREHPDNYSPEKIALITGSPTAADRVRLEGAPSR